MLVNVSNLAWFGSFMSLDQHLQFSQMRALEFQRPVVRSTNTGVTAALDHHGRVQARLPALARGVLEVEVEGPRRQHAPTPAGWPCWAWRRCGRLGFARGRGGLADPGPPRSAALSPP